MTNQRKKANALSGYRQSVLSGWGDYGKPDNWDGDSKAQKPGKPVTKKGDTWQQKRYKILVPVIIDEISYDGNQYRYSLSINANTDISVFPVTATRKEIAGQGTVLPAEKGAKWDKVSMVSRVQPEGKYSLSYPSDVALQFGIAQIYSHILGTVDRAIERRVQFLAGQEGQTNTRGSKAGASSQKGVGTNKKTRRSKKVLPQVRTETTSETSANLDGFGRKVLGHGQGNGENKTGTMDDNPDF